MEGKYVIIKALKKLVRRITNALCPKELAHWTPAPAVWESFAAETYTSGWIYTDHITNAIYIDLNSPGDLIVKISKGGIVKLHTGLNPDGVFLKSSHNIQPFQFLPEVSISEGMKLLKATIFDNLTCALEQRYLVVLWTISALLRDFILNMTLLKISGPTASGKKTAA